MSNITFTNNGINNTIPASETKKKLESQENFTALDREKLKQDAAEFSKKTEKQVKENWLYRNMRNVFGVEDPKKTLISIGATIASVAGVAFLGNKFVGKSAQLGINIDNFLNGNNFVANIRRSFNKKSLTIREKISNFINNNEFCRKTANDIKTTFKDRHAKQKCDAFRGYGNGPLGIFSLTPVDTIKKALKNTGDDDKKKLFKCLFGDDNVKIFNMIFPESSKFDAQEVLKEIFEGKEGQAAFTEVMSVFKKGKQDDIAKVFKKYNLSDSTAVEVKKLLGTVLKPQPTNIEICDAMVAAIDKTFGCNGNKQKLLNAFNSIKKGDTGNKDLNRFIDVIMMDSTPNSLLGKLAAAPGKIIGDWWPVRMIDKAGKKIFKDKWKHFGRGNLGDSLIKYCSMRGTLADTGAGKFAQMLPTLSTESYSNFVNDKSGLGVFLAISSIMPMFNNVQDAPKGKKGSTVTDSVITSIGSWALSMPIAFKAVYGLATLKNLKGATFLTNALKQPGKIFGMGLDKFVDGAVVSSGSKTARYLGGALRFALIWKLQGIVGDYVKKAVNKVFGKPYNKAEEEQKKKLEEQKNTIVPELGITAGELEEKIKANPNALVKLQNKTER